MKGEERKEEKKGREEGKTEVINVNRNSTQTSISRFLFGVHLLTLFIEDVSCFICGNFFFNFNRGNSGQPLSVLKSAWAQNSQ